MSLPKCYKQPDDCPECRACGVRDGCWEAQAKEAVFLLPKPRPVERKGAQAGPQYVKGDPEMATPEFERAKNFEMPWGQYKGQTLDKIAYSDEGLRYIGEFLASDDIKDNRVRLAAQAYINDPLIWKDFEAVRS